MKNLWFIFIGMLLVLTLFFWKFTNWNVDKPIKKSVSKPTPIHSKIQVPMAPKVLSQTNINTATSPSKSSFPTHKQSKISKKETAKKPLEEYEQIDKKEISEANPDEIEIKSTQKTIIKTTALTLTGATELKIKIKARERNGIVKAKIAISNDMLTYAQAQKKGRQTHFITHITGTVENRVVYDVSTSQFLSKNPLMKFSFKGHKGEMLTILYQQLTGEVFYARKQIR